jgi:hypothetical protein
MKLSRLMWKRTKWISKGEKIGSWKLNFPDSGKNRVGDIMQTVAQINVEMENVSSWEIQWEESQPQCPSGTPACSGRVEGKSTPTGLHILLVLSSSTPSFLSPLSSREGACKSPGPLRPWFFLSEANILALGVKKKGISLQSPCSKNPLSRCFSCKSEKI